MRKGMTDRLSEGVLAEGRGLSCDSVLTLNMYL